MRALLVVNPKATTTSGEVCDVLARALGDELKVDVVRTEARDHATALAADAVRDGLDIVVALGGDGTVNEVVNGLLVDGPKAGLPALAVIPGGSANVFARALGLPNNPVEATSRLLEGVRGARRRTIGLGKANERYFTFCAGLGMDAEAVRLVEGQRSGGKAATPTLFIREGLRQFFLKTDRASLPLTVTPLHGSPERLALALVCNSDPWTYMGNRPVRPCPEAGFELGLDLFGLRSLATLGTLRHLRQILVSQPRPRGRAVYALHDQEGFTITSDRPAALQLDGDDLGNRSEVVFRSTPRALEVVI